jgi:hypothetical protein
MFCTGRGFLEKIEKIEISPFFSFFCTGFRSFAQAEKVKKGGFFLKPRTGNR